MTPKLDVRREDRQVPSPPTERVIAVMHLLAAQPERNFSLADISRSLGISRATGHAILTTLARHHWIVKDEQTAAYSWGPAMGAWPTDERQRVPSAPTRTLLTPSWRAGLLGRAATVHPYW